MQFFKALRPVQILSFDLDDTLYDNAPILVAAEQAMLKKLHQTAPVTQQTDSDFWRQHRLQLLRQQPEFYHDVSLWRQQGLIKGLQHLGVADDEVFSIAEQAFHSFIQVRCNVTIDPAIKSLLQQLSKRYRLIAITNGNASLDGMQLNNLFEFSLSAGKDGRMKPYPDLFLKAARQLQVKSEQILHIGDSYQADVTGALGAGCQAAWLDHHNSSVKLLPHIRLTHLQQLRMLPAV